MKQRRQKTIEKKVSVEGTGLHTGEKAVLNFLPADPDTGIILRRVDINNGVEINVSSGQILHKARRTTMSHDDLQGTNAEVQTIEHVIATIKGLQIDNLILEINNVEVPGLDGSARPFVEKLQEAGIVEQNAYAPVYELREPIPYEQGDVSMIALPHNGPLKISYTLDYEELSPRTQYLSVELTPETFTREIAPSRTFCMRSEVQQLRRQGLGKGSTTQNTLVMDGNKPVDNELRFPDELVRHKILDLVGDLFLINADVNMHIIAVKSGHSSNMKLVEKIRKQIGGSGVVFEYEDIKKILPHRYPFLLVDRIIEMEEKKRIVGVKSVTCTEGFFQGHFPDKAVMPGVLQVEAMAQTAGILFLANHNTQDKIPMLVSVDNVKWRKPVVPGDQLRMEVDIIHMAPEDSPRRGKVSCKSYVKDDLASQAEIKFIMVDKEKI